MEHKKVTSNPCAGANFFDELDFSHIVVQKAFEAINKHNMLQNDSKEQDKFYSGSYSDQSDQSQTAQNKKTHKETANFPIVLMVSGGSDSTALCLLVHELSQMGFVVPSQITVLHVNHGLRGKDADNDALFVKKLAGLCGFGIEVKRIDIDSCLDNFEGNVENAGRFLRYELSCDLLNNLCIKAGTPLKKGRIWVAHTQDDRVETFFMRSIVGTGPGGLASIRYINGRIARPILNTTREELRDYIKKRVSTLGWQLDNPDDAQVEGGFWREDLTNYNTDGFRTFVRHELIPLAKQKNPNLGNTLSRTMDLIEDEDNMVQDAVEQLKSSALSLEGEQGQVAYRASCQDSYHTVDKCIHYVSKVAPPSRYVLDLEQMKDIQTPLLRRLIYSICKDILPYEKRIEQRHIDLIMRSMLQRTFAIDLPGGAHVYREYDLLIFEIGSNDVASCKKSSDLGKHCSIHLPVPSSIMIDEHTKISVYHIDNKGEDNISFAKSHASKTEKIALVDEESLLKACNEKNTLTITYRHNGDVVYPLGMGGKKKKLSDIFVDKKIPRQNRDNALIVRAGNSIVWVVGVVHDNRFRVRNNKPMLCIRVEDV